MKAKCYMCATRLKKFATHKIFERYWTPAVTSKTLHLSRKIGNLTLYAFDDRNC